MFPVGEGRVHWPGPEGEALAAPSRDLPGRCPPSSAVPSLHGLELSQDRVLGTPLGEAAE